MIRTNYFILPIFAILLITMTTTAQVSVFNCNTYVENLTQAELEAVADYIGNCVEMDTEIERNGTDYNKVEVRESIHVKEGFHAGSFSDDGVMHLKLSPYETDFDIQVTNYSDLYNVKRYKKLELGIDIPQEMEDRINTFIATEATSEYALNPFLEWEVDIEMGFYHPESGTLISVDAFYYREYERNESTKYWDDVGTDLPFRARFAPTHNGMWLATMQYKNKQRTCL